jgi:germination protein M
VTRRRVDLLTVLGLLALLVALAAAAPRWALWLGREVGSPDGEGEATPSPAPVAPARQRITAKLFFSDPAERGLVIESREVAVEADLPRQARLTVEELIKGSRQGFLPTLDPATRVLAVFVLDSGAAYVDLSAEAARGAEGSEPELLAVYSVVNSLATSFPAIRRVQILVEDQVVPTLSGHVDLTRPLLPDLTLLAPSPLTPRGGAS